MKKQQQSRAKDAAIFVRLRKATHKKLQSIARRHDVTISQLVRWGIDQVIERDLKERGAG